MNCPDSLRDPAGRAYCEEEFGFLIVKEMGRGGGGLSRGGRGDRPTPRGDGRGGDAAAGGDGDGEGSGGTGAVLTGGLGWVALGLCADCQGKPAG